MGILSQVNETFERINHEPPVPIRQEEWRCPQCNRLLARLSWVHGTPLVIETVCPKCGHVVIKQEQAA